MSCLTCNHPTPVISVRLARQLVERIPDEDAYQIRERALGWLLNRDPGVKTYLGITGRNYTDQERVAIADETAAVHALGCPFLEGERCLLNRLGPAYTVAQETQQAPYQFLPAVVLRLTDPALYKQIIKQKEVADAKVTELSRNEAFHR